MLTETILLERAHVFCLKIENLKHLKSTYHLNQIYIIINVYYDKLLSIVCIGLIPNTSFITLTVVTINIVYGHKSNKHFCTESHMISTHIINIH